MFRVTLKNPAGDVCQISPALTYIAAAELARQLSADALDVALVPDEWSWRQWERAEIPGSMIDIGRRVCPARL